MTWAQFHSASETAAIEALQAYRDGHTDRAALLYAKAAELEQQALDAVDSAKARTRGITAVSAVSLWYKAAAFGQAEQLAHSMLADPALPPFAKTDLRNLVQAIWTESAKKEAQAEVNRLTDAGNHQASLNSSRPSDEDIWRQAFMAAMERGGVFDHTKVADLALAEYRKRWPR